MAKNLIILSYEGVAARLIQTNKDFNLFDLAELRFFIDNIESDKSYTISDENWEAAKSALYMHYGGSEDLQGALRLLGDFEAANNKTKYKTDLKQFIRDGGCFLDDKDIIRFSGKFKKQIDELAARGYRPTGAHIRHIVYWKSNDSDMTDEIKIVLPNVEFAKTTSGGA